MAQKVMLQDVENDGEILLLADGRRLNVSNPSDAVMASIWMPEAALTIRKRKGAAFNVRVTNEETGETIAAVSAS